MNILYKHVILMSIFTILINLRILSSLLFDQVADRENYVNPRVLLNITLCRIPNMSRKLYAILWLYDEIYL